MALALDFVPYKKVLISVFNSEEADARKRKRKKVDVTIPSIIFLEPFHSYFGRLCSQGYECRKIVEAIASMGKH